MYEIDTFIFTLQPRLTVESTKYAARAARCAVFLLQTAAPIGTIARIKPPVRTLCVCVKTVEQNLEMVRCSEW